MPVYQLSAELSFPPPEEAEDGLLALGGDLRPDRLLLAYRLGIFPWYVDNGPILWWSPDPRLLLYPDDFHLSGRTWRHIRQAGYEITLDTDFPAVIRACAATARKGEPGTWITPEMQAAYNRLYEMGFAHAFECRQSGKLVGGLYGLSLGACFFGESMFSHQSNASKAALAGLVDFARAHGFHFIDCQLPNEHLQRLGAQCIHRKQFLRELAQALQHETCHGRWKS